MRISTPVVVVSLVTAMGSGILFAAGQGPSTRSGALPVSTPVSELEIGLVRGGGGACAGRCVRYRITVRGTGLVRFENLTEPSAAARQRTVTTDEVVSLMNEFLRARFFDASDRYDDESFLAHEGGLLLLRGGGASDGSSWDLSCRLGPLAKTVRLNFGYPPGLAALRDRVERMGGPEAWTAN
jgi:hypothetical protein